MWPLRAGGAPTDTRLSALFLSAQIRSIALRTLLVVMQEWVAVVSVMDIVNNFRAELILFISKRKCDAKADDCFAVAGTTRSVSGARANKTELIINCANLGKQADLLAPKDQSCLRQNWGTLTSTIPKSRMHLRK